MSKYPTDLDDDSSIPSVIDGSTEISGDVLNSLKSAVLAVEQAIGKNPQGSLADLVSRIAVSINDDGTLKASALVIAAITNSQVAVAAGIEESKLALDFSTQALKDQITSNDIDIATLQDSLIQIIADFGSHHTSGEFPHESGQVLLDHDYPSSTPPWLVGISGTTVEDAIRELSEVFANHISSLNADAHDASSISVLSPFGYITASTVQGALEQLEAQRSEELRRHLDNSHSNGISAWENDPLGWNRNMQLYPETGTSACTVLSRYIVDFGAVSLFSDFRVSRGEVLVVGDQAYTIADVGPRTGIGSKPTLGSSQIELFRPLPISSGIVQGAIFEKSSVSNLKVALAATIFPGTATADSIILARPNAAKVVSLGLNPIFVDAGCELRLQVSTGESTSKTVTITDLHLSRDGSTSVPEVTAESIVARINYVLSSAASGNAIPASAYAIGSEIAIAHNWSDSSDYWISVLADASPSATAKGAAVLGFGSTGAAVVGAKKYPSVTGQFTVNGNVYQDFANYYLGTASIAGNTISIPVSVPAAGILPGHIIHVLVPGLSSEIGSYQITAVGASTVQVGVSLSAKTDAVVRIDSSSVSVADLDGSIGAIISEILIDKDAFTRASLRASCQEGIAGIELVDISDSRLSGTGELVSSEVSPSTVSLKFEGAADSNARIVRKTMSGRIKVYDKTGMSYAHFVSNGSIGTGSSQLKFYGHADEEEMLEIASIRFFDRKVRTINDRRLFGSLGLDELREDITQAYVETPLAELRSSGVVRGFSRIDDGILSSIVFPDYPAGTEMILIDGGIAYVDGVRVEQTSQYVPVPPVDGNYFICINTSGLLRVINETSFSLSEILEGFAGALVPLISLVRLSGSIETQEIAYNIANIDERVDAVLDLTNNFVGNFSNIKAAIAYLNAYPFEERSRLRIVSRRAESAADDIIISDLQIPATIQLEGYVRNAVVQSDCSIIADTFAGRSQPHAQQLNIDTNRFSARGLILQNVQIDVSGISDGNFVFEDCDFVENSSVLFIGSGLQSIVFRNCSSRGGGFNISYSGGVGAVTFDSCRFSATPGSIISPHGGSINIAADSCSVNDTILSGIGFTWGGTGTAFGLTVSNLEISDVRVTSSQDCFASRLGHAFINDLRIKRAFRISGTAVDLGQTVTSRIAGLLIDSCEVQFTVGVPSLLRGGGESVLDGAILSELSIPEPKSTDPHISIPSVFGFLYDGSELVTVIADNITDSTGIGSTSASGFDGITGLSDINSLAPNLAGLATISIGDLPANSAYILSGNTISGPLGAQQLLISSSGGYTTRGLVQAHINASGVMGASYRVQRNPADVVTALGFLDIVDVSDDHPVTPSSGLNLSGYILRYDITEGLSWAFGPPVEVSPGFVYRLYTCDYSGWIDVRINSSPVAGENKYIVYAGVKNAGKLLLAHYSWDGAGTLGTPVDKRYFGNIPFSDLSDSVKDTQISADRDLRSNSIFSGGLVQSGVPGLDPKAVRISGPVIAYIGGKRFTPIIKNADTNDTLAFGKGGYAGIMMSEGANYLYINSLGAFSINTDFWPSGEHAKIAAVVVATGVVVSVEDERISYLNIGSDGNFGWDSVDKTLTLTHSNGFTDTVISAGDFFAENAKSVMQPAGRSASVSQALIEGREAQGYGLGCIGTAACAISCEPDGSSVNIGPGIFYDFYGRKVIISGQEIITSGYANGSYDIYWNSVTSSFSARTHGACEWRRHLVFGVMNKVATPGISTVTECQIYATGSMCQEEFSIGWDAGIVSTFGRGGNFSTLRKALVFRACYGSSTSDGYDVFNAPRRFAVYDQINEANDLIDFDSFEFAGLAENRLDGMHVYGSSVTATTVNRGILRWGVDNQISTVPMIDFRNKINSVRFSDLRIEYNGDAGIDGNCWIKNPGGNLVVENCGFAPTSTSGGPLHSLIKYDSTTNLGGATSSLTPGTLFKNCNFINICNGQSLFILASVAMTGRIAFENCTVSGSGSSYGRVVSVENSSSTCDVIFNGCNISNFTSRVVESVATGSRQIISNSTLSPATAADGIGPSTLRTLDLNNCVFKASALLEGVKFATACSSGSGVSVGGISGVILTGCEFPSSFGPGTSLLFAPGGEISMSTLAAPVTPGAGGIRISSSGDAFINSSNAVGIYAAENIILDNRSSSTTSANSLRLISDIVDVNFDKFTVRRQYDEVGADTFVSDIITTPAALDIKTSTSTITNTGGGDVSMTPFAKILPAKKTGTSFSDRPYRYKLYLRFRVKDNPTGADVSIRFNWSRTAAAGAVVCGSYIHIFETNESPFDGGRFSSGSSSVYSGNPLPIRTPDPGSYSTFSTYTHIIDATGVIIVPETGTLSITIVLQNDAELDLYAGSFFEIIGTN